MKTELSSRQRAYRRLLRDPRWRVFRQEVIEVDGGRCRRCGRSEPDALMQVHHVRYVAGRRPWQYDYTDLETLCAGCHAREHGILPPHHGWSLVSEDDLRSPDGECERCGTIIRYVFLVDHPKWEPMEVGTVCCDDMTGTEEASKWQKLVERRDRFATSTRWAVKYGRSYIRQGQLDVFVLPFGRKLKLNIGGLLGRVEYETETAARMAAFDVIESGAARRAIEAKRTHALVRVIR